MREPDPWYKVTLLFPLRDNDGNLFEEEVWRWWLREIAQLCRGFTDLGVVKGWWQNYSDQNRWIVMIVKSEREVDAIRNFLRVARTKFRQEAMYLDYHSVYFEEVS